MENTHWGSRKPFMKHYGSMELLFLAPEKLIWKAHRFPWPRIRSSGGEDAVMTRHMTHFISDSRCNPWLENTCHLLHTGLEPWLNQYRISGIVPNLIPDNSWDTRLVRINGIGDRRYKNLFFDKDGRKICSTGRSFPDGYFGYRARLYHANDSLYTTAVNKFWICHSLFHPAGYRCSIKYLENCRCVRTPCAEHSEPAFARCRTLPGCAHHVRRARI